MNVFKRPALYLNDGLSYYTCIRIITIEAKQARTARQRKYANYPNSPLFAQSQIARSECGSDLRDKVMFPQLINGS